MSSDSDSEAPNGENESDCDFDDSEVLNSDNESNTSEDSEHNSDSVSDSDDEVLETIRNRQELKSENPKCIISDLLITDICFHPEEDKIAVAFSSGQVDIYEVGMEESPSLCSFNFHNDSCRGVDFFPDGKFIVSVSIDGSMVKTDIEKETKTCLVSDSEVEFWNIKVIDSRLCVTGDESGSVHLWDLRTPNSLFSTKMSNEVISHLLYSEESRRLLCTTGDGELVVNDLRWPGRLKLFKKSEPYSSELTSCSFVRSERNVVCSSGQGDLLLFDWDPFDYQTFKPYSGGLEISCLLSVSENIVIAGYEDGKVSAIHLYPNHLLGLVGKHQWDVSKLDINSDGSILASAGESVKFWKISYLEDVESAVANKKSKKETDFPLPSSEILSRQNFFSDLN